MSDTKGNLANAREQGQAQFNSILELVTRFKAAQDADAGSDEHDEAREAIEQDALSVEIRYGWHSVGAKPQDTECDYRILLCTGGPACQIFGRLNQYNEPDSAVIQVQDWFTPWTDFHPTAPEGIDVDETLIAYARVFYFGE